MDIIMCVKHVPKISEADIVLDDTGTGIEEENVVFEINDRL